ncbi:hypothetical protein [Streptomyces sp. NPDC006446]|uniref:hypothetical protein n=1 Tax=Streptomyces sp. NPDC006446 TaxID=3154301 RepID=UPI0033B1C3EB
MIAGRPSAAEHPRGTVRVDAREPWTHGLHADTGCLPDRLGLRSGQPFIADAELNS